MTRGHSVRERFGASLTTWPLWARCVATAPIAMVVLALAHTIYAYTLEDDPRPAALAVFFLAFVSFMAAPFLRGLWVSNPQWKRDRAHEASLQRKLADSVRRDAEVEALRQRESDISP